MRMLLMAVAVVAVANLLALGGVAGWLAVTDRLDVSRLRAIREVLTPTITEQRAKEEAARLEAEAREKEERERAKVGQPPIRAGEALEIRLQQGQADQVRMEGFQRDVQILRDTLARERRALEEERAALEAQRAAWERMRQQIESAAADEQFKKTLATLEGLKPDKAKTTLQELINAGQRAQVVEYLNAMSERTRTRVVDEFVEADPRLASELLEQLRTRGQLAGAAGSAPR